ncbi:hypothetical protein [Ruegeria arenilitoris]|uniref:Uncharacterized protein n=1 Tax=Ruegeria arenilitoris TaxID=1173585 RepID=A0A238K0T3_9RHOB|nr:hypothetical protein [Ruegeria arenilitoris]SMX36500.1 hypothetical protein RUA8715_01420 [Ruegeria arenilitoris]
MTDRFENFRSIAAADPEVQKRFEEGAAALAEQARRLLDISIDPADLIQIDALRLAAVVGDEVDNDRALVELQRLDEVKGLIEERERAEKIKMGDEDEVAKLNKLPRHLRMARARDLGINDLAPKSEHGSVADPATLYQQAMKLRPADRIAFMRKHGLA